MRKCKRLWIILAILIIAIAVINAFILLHSNCDITISAEFQMPRWDDGISIKTVYPSQDAEWSKGSHEAPFTPIKITNGKLSCSIGYGPIEIAGCFSREEILRIWPEAPIDKDWDFGIGLFDCHVEDRGYHMYCNVQVDTQTGLSTADLYIFENGFASPEIDHWEGKVGEKIILSTDF